MSKGFCENCNKLVEYKKVEINTDYEIRGKKYNYKEIIGYCKNCNEEISANEITDENLERLDNAFRTEENIIKTNEIEEILKKYKIGKKPLAKLLGWGEVTLIRYLNGDIPTKIYSDELYKILTDFNYMESLLENNKANITERTYKNVKDAITKLNKYGVDIDFESEIDLISEYIIMTGNEITPLALQKILYYAQGFYECFFGKFLFKDDCEAWIHGPVYPKIYNKYRFFKYENIPTCIDYDVSDILNDEKKDFLDVIIKCFGYYNGKALEKMSHYETPWLNARKGIAVNENSNNIIKKSDITEYFHKVKEKYDMLNLLEIKKYSEDQFNKVIGI